MKVLVIGGTQFVGRHTVEKLLDAGHDVTLMNRGKTAPSLFPSLPRINADRESEEIKSVNALRVDWDAVIDLCAYYPKNVSFLLNLLKGHVGRYVLCSSVSAYTTAAVEQAAPMIREDDPLWSCSQEQAVDTTMATYGPRKAECERVAMKQHSSGIPVTIIRPSLVYGAHDHTDRFAYWIWRAAQERTFILPDDGLTITRKTYAPDLGAAFATVIARANTSGKAYNVAETDPFNFRDTVFFLGEYLRKRPLENAVSVPAERLLAEGIRPWSDLPLWLPKLNLLIDTFRSRSDFDFVSTDPRAALAKAAEAFLAEGREPKAGISTAVEAEILSKIAG